MLRIEFEQTLAANEQSSPINREIRALVNSSQTYIQQLKDEIARSKKKAKEAQAEISKLKGIIEQHGLRTVTGGLLIPNTKIEAKVEVKTEVKVNPSDIPTASTSSANTVTENKAVVKSESEEGDEESMLVVVEPSPGDDSSKKPLSSPSTSNDAPKPEVVVQPEAHVENPGKVKGDETIIRELKLQLKKEQDSKRELKFLLEAFKSVEKEKREKAQIMANEKKVRCEMEELKHKKMISDKKRPPMSQDEFTKKVCKFEEIINQLESKLATAKQEEDALFNDMDVTGTAFEDMREQNTRLIQQLSQKDDANFKIISERINLTQINKMIVEEKDGYSRQVCKTAVSFFNFSVILQCFQCLFSVFRLNLKRRFLSFRNWKKKNVST